MYCSICGAETAEGSKFCKRCGGNLGSTQLSPPAVTYLSRPTGAAWALAFAATAIGLGGMGIVMASVMEILRPILPSQDPSKQATVVAVFALVCGTFAVLGIIAMLIRVVSRLMGVPVESTSFSKEISQQLAAPMVGGRALQQALQPPDRTIPGSVTEHTTRSFDRSAHREHLPRE